MVSFTIVKQDHCFSNFLFEKTKHFECKVESGIQTNILLTRMKNYMCAFQIK